MIIFIVIIGLLSNQYYYLTSLQFHCEEKIEKGQDLNAYEIFSAMQTHTMFWAVGWIISPEAAKQCFCKQFHIQEHSSYQIPDNDEVIIKAKELLLSGKKQTVRLAWKDYNHSKCAIYLNGSEMYLYEDYDLSHLDDRFNIEDVEDYPCILSFFIDTNVDYKPGRVNIAGLTLSETVFDYLENIGLLYVYTATSMIKV